MTSPFLRPTTLALILAATAVAMPASANSAGPTYEDRRQAACYDDVMRLCAAVVPDYDRVKACMLARRKQVSAGCAVFFEGVPR